MVSLRAKAQLSGICGSRAGQVFADSLHAVSIESCDYELFLLFFSSFGLADRNSVSTYAR
jgi:hypothetical protein